MPVGGGALRKLDGAGIVDPVTHVVLIQFAIGHSRREIVEARVEERKVHHEVHRQPVAGPGRRQPFSLEHDVGTGDVLPEAIAQHEPHVGMLYILQKLHGYPHANAISLRSRTHRISLRAEKADAFNARLPVPVAMIDVRYTGYKSGYLRQGFGRKVQVRGRCSQGLANGFLFHDLFAPAAHHCSQVFRNNLIGLPLQIDGAVVHPDRPVGQSPDGIQVVRHKDDRDATALHLKDFPHAALLEVVVADRQRFIDDEDVGIHMNCHCECQTDKHAAGVSLHGTVDEFADLGERFDRRNAHPSLRISETEDGSVEENVLSSCELGIETCPKLQQSGNPALHHNPAGTGAHHAGDNPEKRALAGAVFADDAEAASLFDGDIDVFHGPKRLMKTATPEAQQLADMIRRTPINAEALGDLVGADNRHNGIVALILLERAPGAVSNAVLTIDMSKSKPDLVHLEAIRNVGRLRRILEAVKLLNTTIDLAELTAIILKIVREEVGVDRATVFLVDGEHQEIRSVVAQGVEGSEIRLRVGDGIAGTVAATGEIIDIPDAYADSRFNRSFDTALQYRTRDIYCMPTINREGQIVGVLQLLNRAADFHEDDVEFLRDVSVHIGLALENAWFHSQLVEKNRIEQELVLARDIQQTFYPNIPEIIGGVQIRASSTMCEAVGGDYLDYHPLEDGRFIVMLGDVSGKGIGAALVMTSLHATCRALLRHAHSLERIALILNETLVETTRAQTFVTLIAVLVDPVGRRLHCVCAGHNPPLLVDADGNSRWLERGGGPPVGLFSNMTFAREIYEVPPASTVVIYTDGVTEAETAAEEQFGMERLNAVVCTHHQEGAADIHAAIRASLRDFVGERLPSDDSTLIVLKF